MTLHPGRILTALAAGSLLLAGPAQARVWRTVMPMGQKRPVVLRSDGATARLEPTTQVIGEGDEQDEIDAVRIVVSMPGRPDYTVPADATRLDVHGVTVGIGKLNRADPLPVVILQGYSGGAHCCATFQMVVPGATSLSTIALDAIDGSADEKFPRDLDGDGTIDILRYDDRLLYEFASHAGSWSVPQVWNLRGGNLVDVSKERRFAPVYRPFAAETLRWCRKPDLGRNGACAAYAAAMARMGQAEEGIRTAVRHSEVSTWLPEPCTVPLVEDQCPEGKARTFAGFEDALRWFLKDAGYTD